MSRWAMMLPIVARRSPAITTPPGKVAATIVVPCGARSPACPCGTVRRAGSRSGACADEEVGERGRAGGQVGRGEARPVAHWPPFWMNDFTKSSALVSSTSSISSRIASTSSSSGSLRSATSASARRPRWPPRPRRTSSAASAPVPSPPTLSTRGRRGRPSGQRVSAVNKRLGGVAAVEQLAHVRAAARAAGRWSGTRCSDSRPGQVEDHRVPGRGGDVLGVLLQAAAAEVGAGVLGGSCIAASIVASSSSRSIRPMPTSRW